MSLLLLFPTEAAQATTGTASFGQPAATWDAASSERIPSTAAFTQVATWAGTANSVPPATTGTASFAQAASWGATSSERIPATATFAQSATWAGLATHTDSTVTATASFTQNRMMTGVGGEVKLKIMGYASPLPPQTFLDATGSTIEEWLP